MDLLISQTGFFSVLGIFLAGALASLVLRNHDSAANLVGHSLSIIGSALGLVYASAVLYSGVTPEFSLLTSFPVLTFAFKIDALSAFFMLVISLVALIASVYATGYVRHFYGRYNIGVLGFFYNLFLASMILVVTVHHALAFLIVWEVMSLASYFLVIYEHREPASLRAGTVYFIMAHAGTAFLLMAFLLLYHTTGSFDFGAMRSGMASASSFTLGAIFLCMLIGFGTKAGIIPLHIWLPGAHPAAPSHVSALMSGVMIKTGIYMLIRVSLEMLPHAPLWWGTVVLIIGAISALLGVLHALSEHDLKRLLAYHSIENIGIILLGLGSALVFSSAGLNALAALGLIAALFHTLNHAVFKALLFMGSGAVINATHTRNIEEFGGLIKRMPQTAFFFLVGSMAISALPPFNGFFSEWMTFQSLFSGVISFNIVTGFPFVLAIASLALTGGLAAACFVKVFGATFLARPRSEEAAHAKEAAFPLRLGMAILALTCLLLGVGSGAVTRVLMHVSQSLIPVAASANAQLGSVTVRDGFASVSMPLVFLGMVVLIALTGALVYVFAGKRKVVIGPTWNCGGELTPRMEITATSFSRSIVTVFKGVLRPSQQRDVEYHDERQRYFPKSLKVTLKMRDIYQPYFYEPLRMLTNRASERFKRIQSGNINAYILYIFLTLLVLLIVHVL